jgi:hypothetical protein
MLTKEEISQEIPRKKIPIHKRCNNFVNLLPKTTKNSLSLQTQVVDEGRIFSRNDWNQNSHANHLNV